MTDDGSRFRPFHMLLGLFSGLYATGIKGRRILYRRRLLKTKQLPCRVVSVGNITVGGTGKTPMTIYVARLAQELGYKVAVISRGYKGGAEKGGGIVSDGQSVHMTPEAAGDEPYLLAKSLKGIPVLVGRDRFRSGLTAIQGFGSDLVVLDDAFQHIRLKRDIDLVLLDHRRPFGNSRLLPRGSLREPADALGRCDAVILTRCPKDETATVAAVRKIASRQPVFSSRHVPKIAWVVGSKEIGSRPVQTAASSDELKQRPVFAFSGLADNRNFLESLKELGCHVVGSSGYPDHHPYTDEDLAGILQAARRSGAQLLATTEKDFTKISNRINPSLKLFVIGVQVSFGEEEGAFRDYIRNRLEAFGAFRKMIWTNRI